MSSRTYHLRTRAETGMVAPSRVPTAVVGRTSTLQRDEPPHLTRDTEPMSALYSDVVASRPPSPRKELSTSAVPSTVNNSLGSGILVDNQNVPLNIIPISSSEDRPPASTAEEEGPEWTTVRRRRVQSLSSLDRAPEVNRAVLKSQALTAEQVRTVEVAAGNMTAQQKETFKRRKDTIQTVDNQEESASSRGEGPANPKGKGVDPRNWGNANISQESLDPMAQTAAYESIVQQKDRSEARRSLPMANQANNLPLPSPRLPAESRPVTQIAKNSYLGAALRSVGRKKTGQGIGGSPPSSDPGSSEDETSTSSEEYSSDPGTNSSDQESISSYERLRRRRDHRHGRNKRYKKKSASRHQSRLIIKPIAPKEYDGQADARAYHRFVKESNAYLRDGKVRSERKIFLLSYYLTGKAYDFYTQKVSINEEQWTLRQFYDELFNYCFPVDYRMQLRRTLARMHQNEKTVAEYTHELYELFNMIGDVPERDRVLKFWNGSRPIIQKGLWRDNLNPETSSWDRVVAQAEIIEISEGVAE